MLERDRLGEETTSRSYLEGTSTKQPLSSLRVQKTHEVKTNNQGEQLRKTLFSSSLLSSRPNTGTAFCKVSLKYNIHTENMDSVSIQISGVSQKEQRVVAAH